MCQLVIGVDNKNGIENPRGQAWIISVAMDDLGGLLPSIPLALYNLQASDRFHALVDRAQKDDCQNNKQEKEHNSDPIRPLNLRIRQRVVRHLYRKSH